MLCQQPCQQGLGCRKEWDLPQHCSTRCSRYPCAETCLGFILFEVQCVKLLLFTEVWRWEGSCESCPSQSKVLIQPRLQQLHVLLQLSISYPNASPQLPSSILPVLGGGHGGPCAHERMPRLLLECFLILPLKHFYFSPPFTAFSLPKGKQRYHKLIKSKRQRSRG